VNPRASVVLRHGSLTFSLQDVLRSHKKLRKNNTEAFKTCAQTFRCLDLASLLSVFSSIKAPELQKQQSLSSDFHQLLSEHTTIPTEPQQCCTRKSTRMMTPTNPQIANHQPSKINQLLPHLHQVNCQGPHIQLLLHHHHSEPDSHLQFQHANLPLQPNQLHHQSGPQHNKLTSATSPLHQPLPISLQISLTKPLWLQRHPRRERRLLHQSLPILLLLNVRPPL